MQWPVVAWILPAICFVVMLALMLCVMRRGLAPGMCLGRRSAASGSGDSAENNPRGRSLAALHLLNDRYAKGEIERDEYRQKWANLTSSVNGRTAAEP